MAQMPTQTHRETREDVGRALHSGWMRQIHGLIANIFAAPPAQEHSVVGGDERQ